MGPPGKNASHCADLEDEDSLHKLKLCDVSKKKFFPQKWKQVQMRLKKSIVS
jgi:hypothetical protein